MDLTIAATTPVVVPPAPLDFPNQVDELLQDNGGNSVASGIEYFAPVVQLEDHLQSDQPQFTEETTDSGVQQLMVQEVKAFNVNEENNENFSLEEKPIERPPVQPVKIGKPFINDSDTNYLHFKRTNDPCYKLANTTVQNPFEVSRSHFLVVLSHQNLKATMSARVAGQQNSRHNLFQDLLPNETDINIQMGSIAGYYGDMVAEEDLVNFFGKFLPMYKPISHVVDHITPSVSNKIKSTNFIWRNESAAAASLDQSKRLFDPCTDITFEYVSFKDQTAVSVGNKSTTAASIGNGGDLIAMVGQGIQPPAMVVLEQKQEQEFMETTTTTTGEDENTPIKHPHEETVSQENETQHFTTNLLDENYNDTDFGMELKSAIDLIINNIV